LSLDELEQKIVETKKRGLNLLIENELIADLRGEYYSGLLKRKMNRITDQVRRNVLFMTKIHGQTISPSKIKEFMGMDADTNIHRIIYGESALTSLRTAILIAEFYGVPVEILLFQDIEPNVETFRKLYPALFRQNRD
jgi:hypothetical protein